MAPMTSPRTSAAMPPSTTRARQPVSTFSSLVSARSLGAVADPTRPNRTLNPPTTANCHVGRSLPRKSNARSRVRKPTMRRRTPIAEPARMIPALRSSAFSVASAGAVATRRAGMRVPSTAATRNVHMARPIDHSGPNSFSSRPAGMTPAKPAMPLISDRRELAVTSSSSPVTTVGHQRAARDLVRLLGHQDAQRLEEEDRAATADRADHEVAEPGPDRPWTRAARTGDRS